MDSTVLSRKLFGYDKAGRLVMSDDGTGVISYSVYDFAGRKAFEIDTDGTAVEYRYNEDSQVRQVIWHAALFDIPAFLELNQMELADLTAADISFEQDVRDIREWRYYDAAGRLSKTVDGLGYVTETRYDGASRVVAVNKYVNPVEFVDGEPPAVPAPAPRYSSGGGLTLGDDRLSRNYYDHAGRLIGELDSGGSLVEHKYNGAGQLVETIRYANYAGNPRTRPATIDAFRPSIDSDDIHEYKLYDARGWLIGTIDGEGYLTEIEYFGDGNVSRSKTYGSPVQYSAGATLASLRPMDANVEVQATSYTVTRGNQVASKTGVDGTVTKYDYDSVGNLVSTSVAEGSDDQRRKLVRYDGIGRIIAELTGEGAALLGPTVSEDQVWADYAIHYTYDLAGRRTSMTDELGNRTVYYYDADGRQAAMIDGAGNIESREYALQGQLAGTKSYAQRVLAPDLAGLTGGLLTQDVRDLLDSLSAPEHDGVTAFTFDTRGLVNGQVDAKGFQAIVHNGFGEVVATRRDIGDGRTELREFIYEQHGWFYVESEYRSQDILVQTANSFDRFGRVISNSRGDRTDFDRNGRVVLVRNASDVSMRTTYDAFGRVLTERDGQGNVTTYAYNTAERKMVITTPEGVIQTIINNRHGQVQSVTDAAGNTTTYTYDKNGKLAMVEDSLGTRLKNEYDRAGQLRIETDAKGTKTVTEYDAVGRVLSRTEDSDGGKLVTQYAYDGRGQVLTVTDPRNVVTRTVYDRRGNVKEIIRDSEGLQLATVFEYDERGKALRMTDSNGTVTAYTYDDSGNRLSETVDPEGIAARTSYTYDDRGNVETRTDPLGNTTHYVYSFGNRLMGEIDGAGGVTRYVYSNQDDTLAQTIRYASPLSASAKSTLDSRRNVRDWDVFWQVAKDASRDQVVSMLYDRDNRLRFTVDGTGAVVEQQYDNLGRVAATIRYAERMPEDTLSNPTQWDNMVRETAAMADAERDIRTTFVYDARGRVLERGEGGGRVTIFRYDDSGNVIEQLSSGLGETSSAVQRWLYDGAGRPIASATLQQTSVSEAGTLVYHWSIARRDYDASGNLVARMEYATLLTSTTLAPPTQAKLEEWIATVPRDPAQDRSERMEYDALGRLTQRAVAQHAVDGVVRWSVETYAYDADGNRIEQRRYADFQDLLSSLVPSEGRDAVTRYAYDAAGRLAYTIDPMGAVVQTVRDGTGNITEQVAYSVAIALQGDVSVGLIEQALQSVPQSDRATRYKYDQANRLSRVTDAIGNSTDYKYDGVGRLLSTHTASGQPGQPDRAEYRRYGADGLLRAVIDGEGYVTEMRYTGAGLLERTVKWGNRTVGGEALPTTELLALAQKPPAEGESLVSREVVNTYDAKGNLLSVGNGVAETGRYSYDPLGRVKTYTNGSQQTWQYRYDAAGNRIVEMSPKVAVYGESEAVSVETHMRYDAFGRLLERIEGAHAQRASDGETVPTTKRSTLYGYDLAGHQISVTYPVVQVYDAASDAAPSTAANAQRVEVAQQVVVTVEYDALGNAVKQTDANGVVNRKLYDQLGRVLYDIDGKLQVTGYEYDAYGEVVRQTRFATTLATPAQQVAVEEVKLTRLYRALFHRVPDAGGLRFWLSKLAGGATLESVTGLLMTSVEGTPRFPAGDPNAAIQVVYQGAAGRAPSADEFAQWRAAALAPDMTQGKLVLQILASLQGEDLAVLDNHVDNALHPELLSSVRYSVAVLYLAALGREPSAEELETGRNYLSSGGAAHVLLSQLLRSEEGQASYSAESTPEQLALTLSARVLGRVPEGGVAAWEGDFGSGPLADSMFAILDRLKAQASRDGFALQSRAKANLPALPQPPSPQEIKTLADVRAVLDTASHGNDRVVQTQYDLNGRVLKVAESVTMVQELLGTDEAYVDFAELSKVTAYAYNAFGDVIEQRTYGASGDFRKDSSQVTTGTLLRNYYNARGEKIGQFQRVHTRQSIVALTGGLDGFADDEGGHVSSMEYDASGNMIKLTEYAGMIGEPGTTSYEAVPGAGDRVTKYAYDLNNRQAKQIRENVQVARTVGGVMTEVMEDLVTTYGYDGAGNLVETTNPANGTGYTYYDALGRVRAVATRASNDSGARWTLTEYQRDDLGNERERRVYANGALAADSSGYTAGVQAAYNADLPYMAGDIVTAAQYDVRGNAVSRVDAAGNTVNTSFDASGRAAKEWQTVTVSTADGSAAQYTAYKVMKYDELGQLVAVLTPDAFTEKKTIIPAASASLTRPDVADADGNYLQTLAVNIPAFSGPGFNTSAIRFRIDIKGQDADADGFYDAGTIEADSQYITWADGVGTVSWLSRSANLYYVLKVQQLSGGEWREYLVANQNELASKPVQGIVDAAHIGMKQETLSYNSFGEITRRELNGALFESNEYDNAGRLWRTTAGDGVVKLRFYNLAGQMTAEYRSGHQVAGGLDDLNNYVSASHAHEILDTPNYGVTGIVRNEVAYDLMGNAIRRTGTAQSVVLPTGQTTVERAVSYQRFDRWGNVVEVSDPRDPLWRMRYTYNAGNLLVERRQVTLTVQDGGQVAESSSVLLGRSYYDGLGRKVGDVDARSALTRQDYDSDGNLVKIVQAGIEIQRSSYDLFGRRTALTYAGGAAEGSVTTTYAYDQLGHLTRSMSEAVPVYRSRDIPATNGGDMHLELLDERTLEERSVYDELGREVATWGADGSITRDRYDLVGNLIGTTRGGRTIAYQYDQWGNKIAEFDANGKLMTWTADAYGKVLSHTDLGNVDYTYRYDGMGRLVEQHSGVRAGIGSQNIAYVYAGAQLSKITDHATDTVTTFTYDLAGQHATETTTVQARVVQANTISYDRFGRVSHVVNEHFDVSYEYDNNGNRTRVQTRYVGNDGVIQAVDAHNTYDELNRARIVNGIMENGTVVIGNTGHEITYDDAGRRKTDTYMYQPVGSTAWEATTEAYGYDDAGRLTDVTRDSHLVEKRYYDAQGRLVWSGPEGVASDVLNKYGIAAQTRAYDYDAAGNLIRMKMRSPDGSVQDDIYYRNIPETQYQRGNGFDAMGNLLGYSVVSADDGSSGSHGVYRQQYELFDTYKESLVTAARGYDLIDPSAADRSTKTSYDANGFVLSVTEKSGSTSTTRQFVNDAMGRALEKIDGSSVTRTLIVNGEVVGSVRDVLEADFASTYQPASSVANAGTPTEYRAVAGETSRTIARQVWGDASLWYLIADANGLQADETLAAGRLLKLPARVNTVRDDLNSFKPYNPGEVIGSTAPSLPPLTTDKGCGAVGQLVMTVVAVAVTIYTAGAASALGPVWAGVLGGAAGSVASQAVGNVIGAQQGFSWKGVAMSAVAGGIGGGVSQLGSKVGGVLGRADTLGAIARSAVGNVATQGAGMLTGLQSEFSWRNVAASAIGAGVGEYVGASLKDVNAFASLGQFGSGLARGTVSGLASGTTAAIARGGRIEIVRVATDAFGNALGSSLASQSTPGKTTFDQARFDRISEQMMAENKGYELAAAYGPGGSANRSWNGDGEIMSDSDPTGRVYADESEYQNRDEERGPLGTLDISADDLTVQRVVVTGKRLDPQAQEDWYKYQMRASMPDFGRVAPRQGIAPPKSVTVAMPSYLNVSKGQFTFDGEGNDNPKSSYFSRNLHFPGGASGVTIGRGYDMKERDSATVKNDLMAAGVDALNADKYAKGAGLSGDRARSFVDENKNKLPAISGEQQRQLFEDSTYPAYEGYAKDNYLKATRKIPTAPQWEQLDVKVRDIAVDLVYQQGSLYKSQISAIVSNNREFFAQSIVSDPRTDQYEKGRGRAPYLRGK